MLKRVPKTASWLLSRWVDPILRDMALGDLEEQFFVDCEYVGIARAQLNYWRNTGAAGSEWMKQRMNWRHLMMNGHMKMGLRSLKKNTVNSIINVLGLTIAMSWSILVVAYVHNEYQFDHFHLNLDRLGLVYNSWTNGDFWASMDAQPPVAQALKDEQPAFDAAARLVKKECVLRQGARVEKLSVLGTDPDFFDMFTFPLKYGSPQSFETDPASVYLSHERAKAIYGNEMPLGKILDIEIAGEFKSFTVAGVFERLPSNSSLRFESVIPLVNVMNDELTDWTSFQAPLCVRLAPGANMETVKAEFKDLMSVYLKSVKNPDFFTYRLAALRDYHFNESRSFSGFEAVGNASAVWLLAAIAVLVLVIASVNYINLALGSASTKLKQVGVRKVLGADRSKIIRLFLTETTMLLLFSAVTGAVLAQLALPIFRHMTGRDLLSIPWTQPLFWGGMLIITLVTAFLAGVYPAFSLSRVQPVALFNGRLRIFRKRRLSNGLIVFQFIVSFFMICAMVVVLRQHRFMLAQHFGSDMNHVVEVDVSGAVGDTKAIQGRIRGLRKDLAAIPGVDKVAGAEASVFFTMATIGDTENGQQLFCFNHVDANYIDMMGFTLLEGEAPHGDATVASAYVTPSIIQKSLKEERSVLGMTIKQLLGRISNAEIKGVLDDFYVQTLKNRQSPHIVIVDESAELGVLYARIKAGQRAQVLTDIEKAFTRVFPNVPFSYTFVDDKAAGAYREEQRWALIVKTTASVALFIALSGLYGLTLMAAIRRRKEISIRKVLGASLWHVQAEVQREFLGYVLLGNVLALPLVYKLMSLWLQDFVHRTALVWWIYGIGMLVTMLVAVLTIGFQGLRVTRSNPLPHLRNE